jgi:hypothetical protein
MTFALAFGFSNILYIISDQEYVFSLLGDQTYYWLSQAMLYILLGAFAMWQGYLSGIGNKIASKMEKIVLLKKSLRKEVDLNFIFIFLCFLLSVISRLTQISLGVFGYSGEIDQFYSQAKYTQTLSYGSDLGKLALLGLSISYFSQTKKDNKLKITFYLFLIYEIIFGFLAGFKGAVIMPIVIVGVSFYVIKGKLPKSAIVLTMVLLYFAYMIIEPFRITRYEDSSFQNRNLLAIGSTILDSANNVDTANIMDINEWVSKTILSRANLTGVAARSIEYKTEFDLPENSPEFLKNLLFSPLYAIIPRIIMPSKPISDMGLWYSREMWGAPDYTVSSVGMSPIGYLFFAGGGFLVFIGFFTIGIIQRVTYSYFWSSNSGKLIIYLGLLGVLVNIDSAVNNMFSSFIQMFFLLLFGQFLLFKR